MDCIITQKIVHAAHVVHRNVLTSHSLLCAGRHSWSHVRAFCTNIGAVLGQSAPGTAYKRKSVLF